MKYNYLILALLHLTFFNLSWSMEELPFQQMRNPQEVIEKFNNTIVIYTAATQYLTASPGTAYSTNPWVGFVSPRISDERPLEIATHSIKKLLNTAFFGFGNQESLLTHAAVLEGNLKMRAATPQEIKAICEQWCPATYDFDYETWAMIKDIATNYCCPPQVCCWPSSHQK